jgi:hypothetical protein
MESAGHVARMGEMRIAQQILIIKLDGKRPLGMRRRKWEYIAYPYGNGS